MCKSWYHKTIDVSVIKISFKLEQALHGEKRSSVTTELWMSIGKSCPQWQREVEITRHFADSTVFSSVQRFIVTDGVKLSHPPVKYTLAQQSVSVSSLTLPDVYTVCGWLLLWCSEQKSGQQQMSQIVVMDGVISGFLCPLVCHLSILYVDSTMWLTD